MPITRERAIEAVHAVVKDTAPDDKDKMEELGELLSRVHHLHDETFARADADLPNTFIVGFLRAEAQSLPTAAAATQQPAAGLQVLSDRLAVEMRAGMEALSDKMIETLSEMFTEKVAMSSVSQSTAMGLLDSLGLHITSMPLAAAIQEEGLGDALTALPELDASEAVFKMGEYSDEKAATLPFQLHLQGKLAQLCASEWDKWAVVDIRNNKMSWLLGRKLFSGYQDLGIFPAGAPRDSLSQLRMGFELKHTKARATSSVAWTKRVMGQSIMELLCSFRVCEWPLDVVVTDGRIYHTLRLRGDKVQVVLDLSAVDGLRLIAARLLQIDASPAFKANASTLDPDAIAARLMLRPSRSQQPAGAAGSSRSQQPTDAAGSSRSQQPADADAMRTAVMWDHLYQLAGLEHPEHRPDLVMEFFRHHPQRVYELPPEIQLMYD